MTLQKWGHYPNSGVMDLFFKGHGDSRYVLLAFICVVFPPKVARFKSLTNLFGWEPRFDDLDGSYHGLHLSFF